MWLFRTQLSGRAHQPIRAGAEQTGLLPLSRLFWWLASRASVVRRRVPTMAFQKGVNRTRQRHDSIRNVVGLRDTH